MKNIVEHLLENLFECTYDFAKFNWSIKICRKLIKPKNSRIIEVRNNNIAIFYIIGNSTKIIYVGTYGFFLEE